MKKLLLYPKGLPEAAASVTEPALREKDCRRCQLFENVRHVCLAPEGKPGGILVVGEKPSRLEDTAGKVFYGQFGLQFRRMLEKWWSGPVQYDYAIRCATGAKKISDKQIAACRPYTANALVQSAPGRILCLGAEAAYSVLGRRVSAHVVRKAFGWAEVSQDPVPVYILPNPALAFKNPFSTRAFEEDLRWALAASHTPWFVGTYTLLVETPEHARIAAKALRKRSWYTYDVETFGLMHEPDFRIEAVTLLGDQASKSYTWTTEALCDDECREILADLFSDQRLAATTQNGKYDDRSVMLDLGATPPRVHYDTRLGRKLLDPEADARLSTLAETVGMGGHKLEAKATLDWIKKELNRQAHPLPEFTPKGKRRKIAPPKFKVPPIVLKHISNGHEAEAFAYGFMDRRTLFRYNARDVWSTREVAHDAMPRLHDHPTISRAWNLVVKDATRAVRQIEHWGFPVDKAAVENLASFCDQKIVETLEHMRQYTDINPASPKQLAEYLFGELGLPSVKETDSGAQSTDADALEALRDKHPYVNHLLEHRKLAKFSGTYAHGMLRHIRSDGRIHPSILIDGAGTGRVSMRDPNLQNVPRAKGSVLGKMARDCFCAIPGWELIEADFSQLELRIAAMLAGDDAMIEDFKNGVDIHSNGATLCCEAAWKIPRDRWNEMTADERDPYRSQIKTVIFGRLYGKTDKGIAREFGVSVGTIVSINKMIWGRYKKLEKFMAGCISESRKTGEAWTWWAGARSRVRPIWRILDQDPAMRAHYERTAGNTSVQGTAAEYATASLDPIVQWIAEDLVPAELVCTVHDSIILHVHKSAANEARAQLKRIMLSHDSGRVPLGVDIKRGPSWGSLVAFPE